MKTDKELQKLQPLYKAGQFRDCIDKKLYFSNQQHN